MAMMGISEADCADHEYSGLAQPFDPVPQGGARRRDSSAIVPLCCAQSGTAQGRRLLADLGRVVAWWGTTVEARRAFARLVRDGDLTAAQRVKAIKLLDQLRRAWDEILPTEAVRLIAESLPDDYALRAGRRMAARRRAGMVRGAASTPPVRVPGPASGAGGL